MWVYQPQFNEAWKITFDVDNRDAETPYTITFRETTGILVTHSKSQSITVGVNIGAEIKKKKTLTIGGSLSVLGQTHNPQLGLHKQQQNTG